MVAENIRMNVIHFLRSFVYLQRETLKNKVMAQKKLVSVRLDADDLQVIDDWVERVRFRNRSVVIDAAVRLAAWMIKNGHARKLNGFYPKWDTMDEFKFEYHRPRF